MARCCCSRCKTGLLKSGTQWTLQSLKERNVQTFHCAPIAEPSRRLHCATALGSTPELPQMMVHLQIAPPHPLLMGHLAEVRMVYSSALVAELAQRLCQAEAVQAKLRRVRSSSAPVKTGQLLLNTPPPHRKIQNRKLICGLRRSLLLQSYRPRAHHRSKAVIQMAYRTRRGHRTPSRYVVWFQMCQAVQQLATAAQCVERAQFLSPKPEALQESAKPQLKLTLVFDLL